MRMMLPKFWMQMVLLSGLAIIAHNLFIRNLTFQLLVEQVCTSITHLKM